MIVTINFDRLHTSWCDSCYAKFSLQLRVLF